jgi:hypothetical protein
MRTVDAAKGWPVLAAFGVDGLNPLLQGWARGARHVWLHPDDPDRGVRRHYRADSGWPMRPQRCMRVTPETGNPSGSFLVAQG